MAARGDGPRIGIDLGGTKIEGVALDAAGTVLGQLRLATPRGEYRGTVEAVREAVLELESSSGRARARRC